MDWTSHNMNRIYLLYRSPIVIVDAQSHLQPIQ